MPVYLLVTSHYYLCCCKKVLPVLRSEPEAEGRLPREESQGAGERRAELEGRAEPGQGQSLGQRLGWRQRWGRQDSSTQPTAMRIKLGLGPFLFTTFHCHYLVSVNPELKPTLVWGYSLLFRKSHTTYIFSTILLKHKNERTCNIKFET